MKRRRNRLHYGIWAGIVIVAGCASRCELSASWPSFVVEYGGDTLWSLMVFLVLGFIFPALPMVMLASLVLVIAFGVEFSQLYSAEWIDSFRATFIGAVALGSGFLWSDFVCYTVGCGVGVIGEVVGLVVRDKDEKKVQHGLQGFSSCRLWCFTCCHGWRW